MNVFVIVLNIFLVFFGWVAVHLLAAKRERDKEKRALGASIIDMVEGLETSAIAYHKNNGRLEIDEPVIIGQITKIERRLRRMRLDKTMEERMYIVNLRKSITFENFRTRKFESSEDDSPLIRGIEQSISALITFVENEIIRLS